MLPAPFTGNHSTTVYRDNIGYLSNTQGKKRYGCGGFVDELKEGCYQKDEKDWRFFSCKSLPQ
jgi:hypothetical protein